MRHLVAALALLLPLSAGATVRPILRAGDPFPGGTVQTVAFWDATDGIEQGDAKGGKFRTPPLWGIAKSAPYLHDGRAATLEDAIAAHDGEARAAREAFTLMTPEKKVALVAFLKTL